MKRLLIILLAMIAGGGARAAEPVSYTRFCATCGVWGADTVSSESQQFIVHGRSSARRVLPAANQNAVPLIQLEPQLLAVTAESTKRAFLHEFGARDAYEGKIHIIILDLAPPGNPIGLVSRQNADGFTYQLGLPGQIEAARLHRALAQALLQEWANRGSRRSAELPAWLIEGVTRQIASSLMPATVLNRQPVTIETLGFDRMSGTRAAMLSNAPLTIQELSFRQPQSETPAEKLRYELCAHVLVSQLLRMNGGQARLGQFLRNLPHSLNWQTAFFQAFRGQFNGPLDLEKWWALTWVDFKGKEEREMWPLPLSLKRLESLLQTALERRGGTDAIPQSSNASLQELLTLTDFSGHREVVSIKMGSLALATLNLAPPAAELARSYHRALGEYLRSREPGQVQPGLKSNPEQRQQQVFKATLKTLDDLDRSRAKLQAKISEPVLQSSPVAPAAQASR